MPTRLPPDDEWDNLYAEATEAFTPGAPIRERDLFAGRIEQVGMLIDAVRQRGRHAVIFGERGVGKTSLSNTFALGLNSPTNRLIAEKINADPKDTFTSLWKKTFKRFAYYIQQYGVEVRRYITDDYMGVISPDDVQIELDNFSLNSTPIIIIDEFDRVQDQDASLLMSDTIKALSDYSVNCTIILVGVAEDISTLIQNHQSISRQMIQVRMPRMSQDELINIVLDRLKRLRMKMSEGALRRIAFLSRGLPYFTHLLGMHATRSAILNKRRNVNEDDLDIGIRTALSEVDQTLKEGYNVAVISQKPKQTLYEPVLLACALAEADELGKFQQKNVENPLADVLSEKRYRATTYAFHMNEFCEEKRGRILENSGDPNNPRYRFRDPLMQPYVILRGLADGRIDKGISERFSP